MSTKPGDTMEDYLAWQLNLVVDHHGEANVSLGIANTPGHVMPRRRLTWKQFQFMVVTLEPLRPVIEQLLVDYDEKKDGGWKHYSTSIEEVFDEDVEGWCREYLKLLASQ